jgi:flagellar hook-associated protein 2
MGELRLPGLATGIDTAALIEQLMAVNSRRLATYQIQKMDYEEETTALNELQAKVNELNSAVTAISNASTLEAYKASTSDGDVLGVSASEDAAEGSHSILIDQLATSETWIQDTSTFDYETDYVGGGTFIYSYNHQERQITAVANETTLEDLVGLINNDEENPGVTASLLYQGGKYHLMLSGQHTGEDYQISLNASSTEVWASSTAGGSFTDDGLNAALSTKITELDQFTGTLGAGDNAYIQITGENHFGTDISPNLDLTITANTTMGHLIESINQHFDGVATATLKNGEIYLTDHINGTSGLEISLGYDPGTGSTSLTLPTMAVDEEGGGTPESLSNLASTSFIQTQGAQKSKIKVDGYPSGTTAEVQTLTPDVAPTDGHYHLSYGGQTTGEIAYNADTTTIRSALEALSTVSSGDITVGGGANGLADGALTFEFLSTAGDVDMISIDDTALTGPTTTCSIVETTKGNDGWISNNSNIVTDAMTGITLILQDVNKLNDSEQPIPVVITLTRDTAGVVSKVQKMVKAYNTLMTFVREKTEYNTETKEMGLLSRNTTVSFLKTQLREPFVGTATGFNDDDLYTEAREIGITVDGHWMLQLDTSELNDALNTSQGFTAAIELLGAVATGSTSSGSTINFYSASSKYTTAGTYDVEVTISNPGSGNVIESARIRLSNGTWHDASINGNIITGDSTFNDSGYGPSYPENGLQLSVDLSAIGTFTDTVRVKKGFAGELEDMLDDLLRPGGRLDIGEDVNEDDIEHIELTIENEEARLERVRDRLIQKFARLERTLTMLQRQLAAVSMVGQVTFGSA